MDSPDPPAPSRTDDGRVVQPDGLTIARWVRTRGSKCLVAFSRGKDSFATVERVRTAGLEPIAFSYYEPGFRYQQRDLDRLEDAFAMPIIRLPHRMFWTLLWEMHMQPPDRLSAIYANIGQGPSEDVMYRLILLTAYARGYWSPDDGEVWVALGVKAADSPMRRIAISTHGPYSLAHHTFMPIWDYRKADILAALDRIGIPLPIDYRIWGSTFDGIDPKYVTMLAKHLPGEFARWLEWYPLGHVSIDRTRVGRGDRTDLDLDTDREQYLESL